MSGTDRVQLGWRVDAEVKERFEQYAAAAYGDTPGRKGRALEDAMQAFMGGDRLETLEQQLDAIAESLGVEKKNGKRTPMADGRYHVPEGKNPGDVAKRRQAVINAVLDMADDDRLPADDYGPFVTQSVLEDMIERIADVHSDKTVRNYLEKITSNGPFQSHPERPGVWKVKV